MEYIQLLDCNRLTSSQYLGGNTSSKALFTNKLGAGVSVNAGDKISVYNSFISEVGADVDALYITDSLLEKRDITYTQITNHTAINGSNNKLEGYYRQSASNITESVDVLENKCNILYNYYKTSNGENYVPLPRRFGYKSIGVHTRTDWNEHDDLISGMTYKAPVFTTEYGSASFNGSEIQQFLVQDDYYLSPSTNSASSNEYANWKVRNDNSRYLIFVQTDTRFGTQIDGALPSILNASNFSPSNCSYIEYIEKLEIELDKGFVSPSTIAEKITNKLREQQQPKITYYNSNASSGGNDMNSSFKSGSGTKDINFSKNLPIGLEINSNTYHTFRASSQYNFNGSSWL
jgi:hypothetical protein